MKRIRLSTCIDLPFLGIVFLLSAIIQYQSPLVQPGIMTRPPTDSLPKGDSSKKLYETVDVEASFTGGEPAWRKFLEANLNPLVPVTNGAPAGTYRVMIQFVVDVNGKISDIKALTRHGYGMEPEVLRILRKSPSWTPALMNGQPVNAYRKQPVTFQITEEKKGRKRNRS